MRQPSEPEPLARLGEVVETRLRACWVLLGGVFTWDEVLTVSLLTWPRASRERVS